jgi:hypothetical protein
MGQQNWGTQDIQWAYYDPLNSDEFDKHNEDIIPVGIYKGGELEIVNNTTIRVKPLVCMISDGTQQARIATTVDADIAITSATPYVILRWTWQPLTNWFMDIMSVALAGTPPNCILPNDIVVGFGVYSWSNLISIDYGSGSVVPRTVPSNMGDFLKVAPTATPSMKVFVSNGWVSYGDSRLYVPAQESPAFGAAGAQPRIDILWVDSLGNLQITAGLPDPSPVPAVHTGKIVLAEVLIGTTTTVITEALITDARPWINLGGAGAGIQGIEAAFLMMGA